MDSPIDDNLRSPDQPAPGKPPPRPVESPRPTSAPAARSQPKSAARANAQQGGRPKAAIAGAPTTRPAKHSPSRDHPSDEKQAADSEQDESPDQEEESERGPFLILLRREVPCWMISLVTHLILLLALAFMSLALPDEEEVHEMVASSVDGVEELEKPDEVELLVEEEQSQENEFKPEPVSDSFDPGIAALGEIDAAPVITDSLDLDGMMAGLDLGDFGAEFEQFDGTGIGALGKDMGMTTFFGVATKGRRFMYVVDNSNSMNQGKFETACAELIKSIYQLGPKQEFYIIFYSDTAYPLFYPRTARSWVSATPENKDTARYWLNTVQRCLKTKGAEAMDRAFAMRPDVIYLLGDGAFTDNTAQLTLARDDTRVTMHTMGFGMKAQNKAVFQKLATKFKGKFHDVTVTPSMVKLSAQKKRPRNNKKNGIWGVALGGGPPKGGGKKKKKN